MDKNKICETLYALPGGAVVRRRKSLVVPAALLLAGVALIVLNNYFRSALSDDVRSALVFVGGTIIVVGAIMGLARLVGSSGAPYYRPSKCFLRCEELYFGHTMLHDVAQCVNDGDADRLRLLERSQVPAVAVILYSAHGNAFAAAQAFEYADLEYRPLTELRIMNR